MKIEKLILELEESIECDIESDPEGEYFNEKDWGMEEGVLITTNQAIFIVDILKKYKK